MLTQVEISKLLNRPLSAAEIENFELYISLTTKRLESILDVNLEEGSATRKYLTRNGYRTVFTDPFTGTPVVTVDGEVKTTDDYSVRQFDDLNGTWFNSIVFKTFLDREIEEISVQATFGWSTLPVDLQMFYAKLFDLVDREQTTDERVLNKKIEDYSITLKDISLYGSILDAYRSVIDKYSVKTRGNIQHGSISTIC